MTKLHEATISWFHGFYESEHGRMCEADQYDIEYYSENMLGGNQDDAVYEEFIQHIKEEDRKKFINDLLWDYSSAYDHSSAEKAYCAEYASELCAILGIPYHGEEMTSPKYYNFESDKIHLKIDTETLKKWIRRLKTDAEMQAKFSKIIKKRCTSHNGFISFHSNDLTDYLTLPFEDWDNIKAGFLVEAIMHVDHADEMQESYSGLVVFEEQLIDHLQGSGFSYGFSADFDKMLQNAINVYRDQNQEDDYIKPLPSEYLKGTVCILPNK